MTSVVMIAKAFFFSFFTRRSRQIRHEPSLNGTNPLGNELNENILPWQRFSPQFINFVFNIHSLYCFVFVLRPKQTGFVVVEAYGGTYIHGQWLLCTLGNQPFNVLTFFIGQTVFLRFRILFDVNCNFSIERFF